MSEKRKAKAKLQRKALKKIVKGSDVMYASSMARIARRALKGLEP
jgi:hypothetical protein